MVLGWPSGWGCGGLPGSLALLCVSARKPQVPGRGLAHGLQVIPAQLVTARKGVGQAGSGNGLAVLEQL